MPFEELWNKTLYPALLEIEKERRQLFKKYVLPKSIFTFFTVLGVTGGLMRSTMGLPYQQNYLGMFGILSLVVLIVYNVISEKPLREYKNKFKENIIGTIVKSLNANLKYSPTNGVTEEEFRNSRLFLKNPDRYNCEDAVEGIVGQTKIKFSEVHAEYERLESNGKGQVRRKYYTIFRGIFFIADFNKPFKTKIIVLPDSAERLLGASISKFFQKANFSRKGELIKLENPEFENEFVVYGEDQIEARYVLTPDLMEKLLQIRKTFKRRPYISFIDNNVNIAIPLKNLFEPSYFTSVIKKDRIYLYYKVLYLVIKIVDILNLNTRIWGK